MFDHILVTLLEMRPHYSQSSRENETPSSGTSPLVSYMEFPPPPGLTCLLEFFHKFCVHKMQLKKMEFERNPSLEFYHMISMICIRVSMRLTVGRETAKNLAVGHKINRY